MWKYCLLCTLYLKSANARTIKSTCSPIRPSWRSQSFLPSSTCNSTFLCLHVVFLRPSVCNIWVSSTKVSLTIAFRMGCFLPRSSLNQPNLPPNLKYNPLLHLLHPLPHHPNNFPFNLRFHPSHPSSHSLSQLPRSLHLHLNLLSASLHPILSLSKRFLYQS
jgi:hypothetical protein